MRLQCAVLCILLIVELTKGNPNKVSLGKNEDMLLFWRRSNMPKCKPFTVFKIHCNQCVCSADGMTSCTRMDCGTREYTTTHKSPKMRSLPEQANEEDSGDTDESN